jgi:hypothetical protein
MSTPFYTTAALRDTQYSSQAKKPVQDAVLKHVAGKKRSAQGNLEAADCSQFLGARVSLVSQRLVDRELIRYLDFCLKTSRGCVSAPGAVQFAAAGRYRVELGISFTPSACRTKTACIWKYSSCIQLTEGEPKMAFQLLHWVLGRYLLCFSQRTVK